MIVPHPRPFSRLREKGERPASAHVANHAILFFALLLAAWFAHAQPPQLRIETGAHTAIIRSLATDAAGRWLLTASEDKTARLWDAQTGDLQRTYRPPSGTGGEGRLEAGAISPDGRWVAVAGWTQAGGTYAVYLFERTSGRLLRRLGGLPATVFSLAFSPDGAWLAAGLYANGGLRLWRSATWTPAGEDRGYAGDIYGLDFFCRAGVCRLAASSYDRDLRLYRLDANGLARTARTHAAGGAQPYALRFSPDGGLLALGYADAPRVDVLDGETLNLRYSQTGEAADGAFASVAWWPYEAGAPALAAGSWSAPGGNRIHVWPQLGRNAARQIAIGRHDLGQLLALPDGGLAWASEAPAWGVLDAAGRPRLLHAPALADPSGDPAALRLDATGQRLSYAHGGQQSGAFDVAARQLLDPKTSDYTPANTAGLAIQGWRNGATPTLHGRPLRLEPFETARSLAITPDGSRFLLGADWFLRLYGDDGREIWRQPAPAPAWAVNVTADGQLAVAAYGDGSIRWHRLHDGRELLAFFPHADGKRWVAWTPSGYYDASPGGEDLIGWSIDQGADATADFYPASRFRSRFHRPDVIDRILASLDEGEALRLANADAAGRAGRNPPLAQTLPPIVRILSPGDGERFGPAPLTVRYSVQAPADAPLTDLKVLVDGRPLAEVGRGLKPNPAAGVGEYSLELTLPPRDLTLTLIAENRHGAGEAAHVRLKSAAVAEFVVKPRLYLLAIGVGDYRDASLKLAYPAKDARDFAAALQGQTGGLYQEVVVKLLPEATAADVLEGLDWLRREVTAKDVGVLFLAGHGVNDADGDYYFLPADADPARLRHTALPYFELKKTLSRLPGKTLAFIDTCHAGNALGGREGARRGAAADIDALVNDLAAAENGVVAFASSTGRQFALENAEWQNGAFTKALLEGLAGRADYTQDGAISINELDTWLANRVKALTANRQTPTTSKPVSVPDFPFVTVPAPCCSSR